MKKLYRSRTNKKIAGICGGLGEYLEIDPTVIRLITVIIAVVTGFFPLILGYIIAWCIVPEEPV